MSCPDCFKGGVHDHGTPTGKEETLYGKKCYVASAPPTSASTSAILFLTDAFGLGLVNNQLLADRYAAETGFKVVVPDIIPGGPAPITLMESMHVLGAPVDWLDIWGQLRRIYAVFCVIPILGPFMYRAAPAAAFPDILKFARAMRADLPAGAKMGVAGFCWGGFGSTRLCTETAVEGGSERLIDAQFCAHPSLLKVPDMIVDAVSKLKVPYSMAIGDKDFAMAKAPVLETEAALKQKVGEPETNNYEIRMYPGCSHGVSHRTAVSKSDTDSTSSSPSGLCQITRCRWRGSRKRASRPWNGIRSICECLTPLPLN
jgi:dienelactone hydrolase